MAGGIKGFDGQRGGKDMFSFDPRKIVIEGGHNPRSQEALRRNIDKLKPELIAAGCVRQPVWVRADGQRVLLVDGESRVRAICELIAEKAPGFDDESAWANGVFTVPTLYLASASDEKTRLVLALEANGGTPLEDWEVGAAYARMVDLGWDASQIATKTGRTLRTVNQCLELAAASPEAKSLLAQGAVSKAAVVQATKKGSEAVAALTTKVKANPGKHMKREKAVDPLRKAAEAILKEVGPDADDGYNAYEVSKKAINALRKAMGK